MSETAAPPVRPVDFAAIAALGPNERYSKELIGAGTGTTSCMMSYVVTPDGGGSPAGLHIHKGDQIFYILEGTMQLEIEGVRHAAPAGSLVVFPAGVPHRNWNDGPGRTVHISVNVPAPAVGEPLATSV